MDHLAIITVAAFVFSFIFALGGVGAAIILIPIMLQFGIPINTVKPVSLFFNTISLFGASYNNIKNKRLDFKFGIPIIISSLLFAILGAYLSKFISPKIILAIFIGFLIFSSFMFLFYKKNLQKKRDTNSPTPYLELSGIGAIAGLFSGLLGVGGGGIISPLMIWLGFDPKKTATITAFVVPFSSFAGFLTYLSMGSVNLKLLIFVSIAGLAGGYLGTHFTHSKLSSNAIKKILAIVLFLIAIKMIYKFVLM